MIKQIYIIAFLSFFCLAKTQTCPSLNMFATCGPISCMGACDATGTVIAFSGTPPFSFFWKPISIISANPSGLCAGSYTIVGTDANNCIDSTLLFISNPPNTCVGIFETLIDQKSIRVHPNPVTNTLNISTEKYFEAAAEIKITNSMGQMVLKLPYTSEIDVSKIPKGYYTIEILTTNSQRLYSKFIKE